MKDSRVVDIIIDAHVHIYDCFDLNRFFDSALSNFRKWRNRHHLSENTVQILILTERSSEDYFGQLKKMAENPSHIEKFNILKTDEINSVLLSKQNSEVREQLYIIAGQQVVTKEKLEVLVLFMEQKLADGQPLQKVIDEIKEAGGLAVLPWGVGKWSGKRGKIIKEVIHSSKGDFLFLGDNGGRAKLMFSNLFDLAQKKGIKILPGSDPLPLPSETRRAGNFGFIVSGPFSGKFPAKSLKKILTGKQTPIQPFGKLMSLPGFLRTQFEYQSNRLRG